MRYLLDANIIIALLNPDRRRPVTRRLAAAPIGALVTSAIVAHELYFGAARSVRAEENRRLMDEMLAEFEPLPLTADDAREAAAIRADLRRKGTPIGPYDVLIAGQALGRGLTLVTNNRREFARIDGLATVDWLA